MKYITIHNYSQMKLETGEDEFVNFLYEHLGKYGDPKDAIRKSVHYAFSKSEGKGGFLMIAMHENSVVGEVVVNRTGMSSYIPENILVYIAVHRDYRGKGIGGSLLRKTIEESRGDVALHVEFENPAKKLYERVGFKTKYAEMRYIKEM